MRTNSLIIPVNLKKRSDETRRQILDDIQSITDEQIEILGREIDETEPRKKEEKEKLYGNKKAILKNLKENHVKIEEKAEMMGYSGKKVYINLPAVGNFEGFKFDYFVSDKIFHKDEFEGDSELENKSYSIEDICKLLKAMNKYLAELGIETDGDMNYENDLKYWETERYTCKVGNCLKNITGLNDWYWLRDKILTGIRNLRAKWICIGGGCHFDCDHNVANLFLRLPD